MRLDGARLTGLSPDVVCRRGVARTFQKLRPFQGLTVLDNVMVGALTRTRDVRHARERARELLERVGLGREGRRPRPHALHRPAQAPRAGARARHRAARPAARRGDRRRGPADASPDLVRLVRDLHAGGLTLLVIEHNMRVITAVAQRIVALHLGEIIADGPPDAVDARPAGRRGLPRPGVRCSDARGAAAPAPALLTVEGLDVAYGDFQVLWEAELRVDDGRDRRACSGPNGAGKSTLMNTISGLIAPARRAHHVPRPAHRRAARAPHGGRGPRARAGAPAPLPLPHRARQRAARRPQSARARPHRAETLARVEAPVPGHRGPGAASSRTRCRAASSRWSRSRAGSWPGRACS